MIEVTQQDIDEGVKASCTKCPIALAIQRQVDFSQWADEVRVMPSAVLFLKKNIAGTFRTAAVYNLPPHVTGKIHDFDSKGPKAIEPFSFEAKLRRRVSSWWLVL